MPLITYIESDGTAHQVELEDGSSVMQGAVDNMIEAIVAECGGACSCATCHCYIDEAWIEKLDPAELREKQMIEFANNRKENSRLSCQIQVSKKLDGLVVHLPESQY